MSIESDPACLELLRRYPKAVAHLWRQNEKQRLSLMFGAGAGLDLGFPSWTKLIERIADHPEVLGAGLVGARDGDPLPTAAQVLFHHFRARVYEGVFDEVGNQDLADRLIHRQWRSIVHEALYKDVPESADELAARDVVYTHLLDVITSSPLTVTYNFDDSIERLPLRRAKDMGHTSSGRLDEEGLGGRDFESLVDPRLVFRRAEGNILHINGYLPSNVLETVEGPMVLNEISFADQLIDSISGAYSTLLHFLTKHTFLLVGLSLNDETLRHLLRQNSILNPGHYHYRVHHVSTPGAPKDGEALTASYFETFNLITLFLTTEEISALGKLVTAPAAELRRVAGEIGAETFFTFYLAGVPGAGKTTTFRHFSSLVAYDEWFEPRIAPLAKPFWTLSDDEKDQVDTWVARQIKLKNIALDTQSHVPGIGINIIDRCPPDAIAFTEPPLWNEKAASIRASIANGKKGLSIVAGTVIFLAGEPRELMYRAKARNRQDKVDEAGMLWQQRALELIYAGDDPQDRVPGVAIVDTRSLSVRAVTQFVGRIIFLDDYVASDLQARVDGFASSSLSLPVPRGASST